MTGTTARPYQLIRHWALVCDNPLGSISGNLTLSLIRDETCVWLSSQVHHSCPQRHGNALELDVVSPQNQVFSSPSKGPLWEWPLSTCMRVLYIHSSLNSGQSLFEIVISR